MAKYILYQLVDPRISDPKERIRYIGYTSKSLKRRLNQHIRDRKNHPKEANTYKNNWISKLEQEGISPEIELILETNNIEDIKLLEVEYITKYKELGYKLTNGTSGGDGTLGRKCSQEIKDKFSKPIKVFDKLGNLLYEFKSQVEASNELNIPSCKISQVCNGIRKSSGGYVFRFQDDNFETYETKSNKGQNNSNKIRVGVFDLEDNLIKEFDCINDVVREYGVTKSTVSRHLKSEYNKLGKRNSWEGKIFKML